MPRCCDSFHNMKLHLSLTVAFALVLTLAVSVSLAQPRSVPGQQGVGSSDAAQTAAKLANMTGDWLSGKLSTPGTSGELREVARSKQNDQIGVRYNIIVKGAPRDQIYTLYSWPINAREPFEQFKGLSISPDGLVVCAGKAPGQCVGEKEDDPVDFVLSPAKGEVFRMALESAEGETKVFFGAVPDPIIEKDNSCSLEVLRLLPKFELILMRGKGYRPNENLFFSSKSYDELHEKQARANSDGAYLAALMPFVKDKQNGKTTVSLKGGACAPVVSFEWGKQ